MAFFFPSAEICKPLVRLLCHCLIKSFDFVRERPAFFPDSTRLTDPVTHHNRMLPQRLSQFPGSLAPPFNPA